MSVAETVPALPLPETLTWHATLRYISVSDDLQHSAVSEELASLGNKVGAERRNEFLAGRKAAHDALKALGLHDPAPILPGPNREPVFPEGYIGSITHTRSVALAAVSRSAQCVALGIDLEATDRESRWDIGERIAHQSEREWIASFPEHERRKREIVLFSAKESIYKAFAPQYGKPFWYKDVVLDWNEQKKCFDGELLLSLSDRLPKGFEFSVGVCESRSLALTWVALDSY